MQQKLCGWTLASVICIAFAGACASSQVDDGGTPSPDDSTADGDAGNADSATMITPTTPFHDASTTIAPDATATADAAPTDDGSSPSDDAGQAPDTSVPDSAPPASGATCDISSIDKLSYYNNEALAVLFGGNPVMCDTTNTCTASGTCCYSVSGICVPQ